MYSGGEGGYNRPRDYISSDSWKKPSTMEDRNQESSGSQRPESSDWSSRGDRRTWTENDFFEYEFAQIRDQQRSEEQHRNDVDSRRSGDFGQSWKMDRTPEKSGNKRTNKGSSDHQYEKRTRFEEESKTLRQKTEEDEPIAKSMNEDEIEKNARLQIQMMENWNNKSDGSKRKEEGENNSAHISSSKQSASSESAVRVECDGCDETLTNNTKQKRVNPAEDTEKNGNGNGNQPSTLPNPSSKIVIKTMSHEDLHCTARWLKPKRGPDGRREDDWVKVYHRSVEEVKQRAFQGVPPPRQPPYSGYSERRDPSYQEYPDRGPPRDRPPYQEPPRDSYRADSYYDSRRDAPPFRAPPHENPHFGSSRYPEPPRGYHDERISPAVLPQRYEDFDERRPIRSGLLDRAPGSTYPDSARYGRPNQDILDSERPYKPPLLGRSLEREQHRNDGYGKAEISNARISGAEREEEEEAKARVYNRLAKLKEKTPEIRRSPSADPSNQPAPHTPKITAAQLEEQFRIRRDKREAERLLEEKTGIVSEAKLRGAIMTPSDESDDEGYSDLRNLIRRPHDNQPPAASGKPLSDVKPYHAESDKPGATVRTTLLPKPQQQQPPPRNPVNERPPMNRSSDEPGVSFFAQGALPSVRSATLRKAEERVSQGVNHADPPQKAPIIEERQAAFFGSREPQPSHSTQYSSSRPDDYPQRHSNDFPGSHLHRRTPEANIPPRYEGHYGDDRRFGGQPMPSDYQRGPQQYPQSQPAPRDIPPGDYQMRGRPYSPPRGYSNAPSGGPPAPFYPDDRRAPSGPVYSYDRPGPDYRGYSNDGPPRGPQYSNGPSYAPNNSSYSMAGPPGTSGPPINGPPGPSGSYGPQGSMSGGWRREEDYGRGHGQDRGGPYLGPSAGPDSGWRNGPGPSGPPGRSYW